MQKQPTPLIVLVALAILVVAAVPSAKAQPMAPQGVAWLSGSYGVASIEVPLRNPVVGATPETGPLGPLWIDGKPARIHYAISEDIQVGVPVPPSRQPLPPIGGGRLLSRVGNLIRELSDPEGGARQTVARRITFLFTGAELLDVPIADRNGSLGTVTLSPVVDPAQHTAALASWWSQYTEQARGRITDSDLPPWVDTYLVAMLSGRLNLPLPDWYQTAWQQKPSSKPADPLATTLRWITGGGETTNDLFLQAALGSPDVQPVGGYTQVAALPVPSPPNWVPLASNEDVGLPADASPTDVEVETLAHFVPPECFYIRYGSFENFLWFQDLTEENGGDISRMIWLSGLEKPGAERLKQQLALQTSEMSRMLGPSVIADQALIGRDLYLDDGAAMGVLFQSTNAFLLRTSLNNDRANVASSSPSITLEEIDLPHGRASLLHSTDHRVRSYLVERGPCFLVTNSQTIADRFLELDQTKQSLAKTPTFRLARQSMPLSRNDTIFAYFSPQMLRGVFSPQYLIELRRRMQSEADIALVHLARLTAASERAGIPNATAIQEIDELVAANYLPAGFGLRSDGSGVVTVGDRVLDTQRGARGTFLPIPDNPLTAVTVEEDRWYREIVSAYDSGKFGLDPIAIGIQRTPAESDDSIERLQIHAEIAPWQIENYGWWARQLGPPTKVAMQFAPDDIVAVQAHVASDTLGPPTHLFAAIKDSNPPPPEDFDGIFDTYRSLKSLPGYLGAWPQPGVIDRLPLGLGRGRPVGPNLSKLIGGVYRYTGGGFSVLSFYPDLMTQSLTELAATEVDEEAQVRVRIGNLKGSRLEAWVNQQLHQRAERGSVAGADFLNTLSRQLAVPADTAVEATRSIFDGVPQCPLGGTYQVSTSQDPQRQAVPEWTSTAWNQDQTTYQSPIMRWFRGAEGRLTQSGPNRLVVDATVDVQRPRNELRQQPRQQPR